jgi:hypothetical protein
VWPQLPTVQNTERSVATMQNQGNMAENKKGLLSIEKEAYRFF